MEKEMLCMDRQRATHKLVNKGPMGLYHLYSFILTQIIFI